MTPDGDTVDAVTSPLAPFILRVKATGLLICEEEGHDRDQPINEEE